MVSIRYLIILLYLLIAVFHSEIYSQHQNILIGNYFTEKSYYPNEPSIAVNLQNPGLMLVATNGPVDNFYYSTNSGESWTRRGVFSFSSGLWGDPCVVADSSGNFYFFHLARLRDPGGNLLMPDRIYCRKINSNNMEAGWTNVSFLGLNPPKMQDKEWAVYDPVSDNIYVVWTEFDEYGSPSPDCHSNVLFSRSTDRGLSWSSPIRINEVSGDCLDGENTPMQAVPTVGPNGEIYVSWAGPAGIVFDKSTDQGETWLDQDIFVSDLPGGRPFPVPGIYRGGSLPMITCDVSGGIYNGTIYINWPDLRSGLDDADIWLIKSTDGGDSWSDLVRVNNDPPGNHQLFSWLAVDQSNGNIYCVFYDRRNYDDNRTDVYLAFSNNGGETFNNHRISETPFIPSEYVFMGDYSVVFADNNIIRPVWARMDNDHVTVWTAIVDQELLTNIREYPAYILPKVLDINSVFPNPFNISTTIEYSIPQEGKVILRLFDILGRQIRILFTGVKKQGVYRYKLDTKNMASGIYFVNLLFEDALKSRKLILMK